MQRPNTSEYDPYYGTYIDRVPEGEICQILQAEVSETVTLLSSLPEAMEEHRYAPDKWSIREVVGHIIDVERVFAARAFWIARAQTFALPSYEQDDVAQGSNAGARPLEELLEEFVSLRRSNVTFFRGLSQEAGSRRGTAAGVEFTVRAFPYIIAGHEIHHRKILEERYLPEDPGFPGAYTLPGLSVPVQTKGP